MSHVCMQAVSSMLNMNINILTTGISAPNTHSCPRCKTLTVFNTGEDLRKHTEVVHHRSETEEERECRIQNVRWTQLTPDSRIRESIPNEKAEELILLHQDDVHFNIIVHKSHNAFKRVISVKEHGEIVHEDSLTIFGEINSPPALHTWAEVSKVHRPGHIDPGLEDSLHKLHTNTHNIDVNCLENNPQDDEVEWQIVGKRGRVSEKYNIPVLNRFEKLPDGNGVLSHDKKEFSCDNCDLTFSTKAMLKTHMKVHKPKSICNCVVSNEHEKVINEVKLLRSELEKAKN